MARSRLSDCPRHRPKSEPCGPQEDVPIRTPSKTKLTHYQELMEKHGPEQDEPINFQSSNVFFRPAGKETRSRSPHLGERLADGVWACFVREGGGLRTE